MRQFPETLPDELLCAELMLFRDPLGIIAAAIKHLEQYSAPWAHSPDSIHDDFGARALLIRCGMDVLLERERLDNSAAERSA